MNTPTKLLLCVSAIAVAGCGSASAAAGAATTPTPARTGRGLGAGTAGQLVQVNGNTLILSTTAGDATVDYSSGTTITSTSTGSPGDIVVGACVVIVGQKDAAGAVTASSVRLSKSVNGSCAAGLRPGAGAGGSPRAFPSNIPRPSGSGVPTPNPNTALVAGLVSAVAGTTITVTSTAGATQSATVPTTLSVTESSPGTAADLTVDSCVRAVGPKNAGGAVQATALTIQPTDASGSCTFTRAGGFGGFGGGGGGGFGGFGGTPAPAG
jgi:hypothetical protein